MQRQPGARAAGPRILRYGAQEKVLQGGASLTTNNRMELRAAIAALEALKRPCGVELYTRFGVPAPRGNRVDAPVGAKRLAHAAISSR